MNINVWRTKFLQYWFEKTEKEKRNSSCIKYQKKLIKRIKQKNSFLFLSSFLPKVATATSVFLLPPSEKMWWEEVVKVIMSWSGNLWVVVMVRSWVNLLTWLLIGCSLLSAANQEPACLLTQLWTMTTAHKFPSQGACQGDSGSGVIQRNKA